MARAVLRDQLLAQLLDQEQFDVWHLRVQWPSSLRATERLADSSMPRPHSSTPQLLLTVSSSSTLASSSASISAVGIPHRPKPPTASEEPRATSATASAALATTLSIRAPARGRSA